MRHDTPVGYWPVRLLPLLAGLLGLAGLMLADGPMSVVAGLLVGAAIALEASGWARRARSRARALGLATLAGAGVCAIALAAVAVGAPSVVDPVVARR